MKVALKLLGWTVFLLVVTLLACSSKEVLREGSERQISKGERPNWVDNFKKHNTDTQRAVVGVSKNYAMESSARGDAILQAQKEAITLISSSVARHLKEGLASAGADADIVTVGAAQEDVTEVMSKQEFEGEVDQYYVEKWERVESGALKQYYKAYVLMLFPKNLAEISAKKMLDKARQQAENVDKENQIKKAEALLEQKLLDW